MQLDGIERYGTRPLQIAAAAKNSPTGSPSGLQQAESARP